mgnify:CR=1 FL=1
MSRNYDVGTRDMASAAGLILARAIQLKALSYGSAATLQSRTKQFTKYAKLNGVGRLEGVTFKLLQSFGLYLADKVDAEEMEIAYAHNLVSSVNTLMSLVTHWKSVSPTKDCHIPKRCAIRKIPPKGYCPAEFDAAIASLQSKGMLRQAAIARLSRELNLRSKEASLIDAKAALNRIEAGHMEVNHGTKGGRLRVVPVVSNRQIATLKAAAAIQGDGRNLIPPGVSWKSWRECDLRAGREALQVCGIAGYHELRAAWACQRYIELTTFPAPVFGGGVNDRELDRQARLKISAELGHNRADVVSEYIGGCR